MQTADAVVVGGGIVGLAAALELAEAGQRVTLLERGRVMEEASWAAAGMLAARDPENPPALRELSDWSLGLYPAWLERVERAGGLRVPLRTQATLQGAHTPAGGVELAGRAFALLREQSLDPRDLCRALPAAARAAGVEVREHTPVAKLEPEARRVKTSGGEVLQGSRLVLAAGAWTAELLRVPVEPRKGQMVCVRMAEGGPQLRAVVRTPELYLVPRGDGRVVVGATVEAAGFDREIQERATAALLRAGARLWPPLAEGVVEEAWTGLRPGTPDALPILGEWMEGVWVAAGHFRNGILLAPATGRLARLWAMGEPAPVDLEPFRPGRFASLPAVG